MSGCSGGGCSSAAAAAAAAALAAGRAAGPEFDTEGEAEDCRHPVYGSLPWSARHPDLSSLLGFTALMAVILTLLMAAILLTG